MFLGCLSNWGISYWITSWTAYSVHQSSISVSTLFLSANINQHIPFPLCWYCKCCTYTAPMSEASDTKIILFATTDIRLVLEVVDDWSKWHCLKSVAATSDKVRGISAMLQQDKAWLLISDTEILKSLPSSYIYQACNLIWMQG